MQINKNFLEWLNKLNYEQLVYEFNIKPPLLEDINRSIFFSSSNPFLKDLKEINELLPIKTKVTGIKYENRISIALQVNIGDKVELVRDYDNVIDRNAIYLCWSKQILGYLSANIAQLLAVEIDIGVDFEAIVTNVNKSTNIPIIEIEISKIH